MSNLELELTFLAAQIPKEVEHANPIKLVDVYVPEDPSIHARLRIRQTGDTYTMTKKVKLDENDASRQNEFDIPLNKVEFDELIKVSDRKVIKERYTIDLAGHVAEVDIFQEELSGLVVIDFEFDSIEEQEAFKIPKECLADVTQEDFIAGGNLAGLKYDDIKMELDRFNYRSLG